MPVAIQVQRSPGSCTPYAQLVVASATNYDVGAREIEAEGAMDYPGEKVAVHGLQGSEGAGSGGVAEGESEEAADLTAVVSVKPSARVKDVKLVDHEEMDKRWDLFFKTDRPYSALRGEATFPVWAIRDLIPETDMHYNQAENTSVSNTAEQMQTGSASAAATDQEEASANDASRPTEV